MKEVPSQLAGVPLPFPLLLKLAGRRCLSVGAGKYAEPRIEQLLEAGADMVVVAPKATSTVQRWAKANKLVWEDRAFELSDLDGVCLAICATSSSATNQVVFEESQKRGVLCCVLDDIQQSDFFFPAVVRRGALQLAVSTAGHSPALELRLQQELEKQYGPEYEGWLEWLAKARASIFAHPLSPRRRRTLLRKLASQRGLDEFLRRNGMAVAEENR